MQHISSSLLMFGVTACLLCSYSDDIKAEDIKAIAKRETPTIINIFAPHRNDCKEDTTTSYSLPVQPKNGRAEIKIDTIKLTSSRFPNCVDKQVQGYQIYYTSKRGFVGTDTLVVKQTQGKNDAEIRFAITVN